MQNAISFTEAINMITKTKEAINMTTKTDRRTFIKSAIGAAAAVALTGTIPKATAQGKETASVSDHKPLTKVNCFSEDGELKEVIFGRIEDFR